VKNVATFFFKVNISMQKIAVQDVDDSQFTSWKIVILGPIDAVPTTDATATAIKEVIKSHASSSDGAMTSSSPPPPGCPFHK
jgi:hypothetical protein